MNAFKALSIAIAKGFFRDKASVFFAIIFPLMFLVLFGGIFNDEDTPKAELLQIGDVSLIDDLPADARKAFDDSFDVKKVDDRGDALDEVRKGDADAAVEMRGDELIAHYTQTDQVRAATTAGTLSAFVDAANVRASGQEPKFSFRAEAVEDDSLTTIQFVTPGLLGWAIAMSAAFGAAATLQGWRQSKLLRRLQLAPVRTGSIVGARIFVTVAVALVQMAIFLGLGAGAFGLKLTGNWWLAIPLIICGTLCFMALGLLAGALAKTTEGAVNLANFFVMPMAFLSGSFFPLDGAPGWLQFLSKLLPLRHLNDGMLDVMVRGEGLAAALPVAGILLAFTAVIGLVAVKLFRWETV
ncbi:MULTISPECIES: ABC transporter permease [unclassified Nocardioides]|uniref:ABC transporter permease n=1 Tax=unclassified Nocardioides TaxID=2615069 RepID=UPI0006FD1E71|nr:MULTISPECIES: ABC transporter permease [unclassified Nocardioides]KQY56458.1 ABC transporter [Nocardioides sp. Root140]KRF14295.1 ABC transporter [Nocardioides sp. Soil796]